MTTINLETLHLDKGAHRDCDDGSCLMEAYNLWRYRKHTDSRPADVSPVLHSMGISLNDVLPDATRQQLKPFIPSLSGTFGDGRDEARSYLALDWLIRTYLPAWLRLVPALVGQADLIAARGPIRTFDDAAAVGDLVREASTQAAAAWDAAGDAAGAAARVAAGAALNSTVEQLQQSAVDLYGRMITAEVSA